MATVVPISKVNYLICHVQYDEIVFARIGVSALGELVFRDIDTRTANSSVDDIVKHFKEWSRRKSGTLVYCEEGIGHAIGAQVTKANLGRTVIAVRLRTRLMDGQYANVKAVAYGDIEHLSSRNAIYYLTPAQREGVEGYFAKDIQSLSTDGRIKYAKGRCGPLTLLALAAAAHRQHYHPF